MNDTGDPVWIDEAWLQTIVVVGLTCFILCLKGLAKVRRGVFWMMDNRAHTIRHCPLTSYA